MEMCDESDGESGGDGVSNYTEGSFVLSFVPIVTEGILVLSCKFWVSQLPSKPSHQ
jgi:hypothetical protein